MTKASTGSASLSKMNGNISGGTKDGSRISIVSTWLSGIGLTYATSYFEAAGIVTPNALAELDVSFFEALGISSPDDRRKLFYLVQRIKMQLKKQEEEEENDSDDDDIENERAKAASPSSSTISTAISLISTEVSTNNTNTSRTKKGKSANKKTTTQQFADEIDAVLEMEPLQPPRAMNHDLRSRCDSSSTSSSRDRNDTNNNNLLEDQLPEKPTINSPMTLQDHRNARANAIARIQSIRGRSSLIRDRSDSGVTSTCTSNMPVNEKSTGSSVLGPVEAIKSKMRNLEQNHRATRQSAPYQQQPQQVEMLSSSSPMSNVDNFPTISDLVPKNESLNAYKYDSEDVIVDSLEETVDIPININIEDEINEHEVKQVDKDDDTELDSEAFWESYIAGNENDEENDNKKISAHKNSIKAESDWNESSHSQKSSTGTSTKSIRASCQNERSKSSTTSKPSVSVPTTRRQSQRLLGKGIASPRDSVPSVTTSGLSDDPLSNSTRRKSTSEHNKSTPVLSSPRVALPDTRTNLAGNVNGTRKSMKNRRDSSKMKITADEFLDMNSNHSSSEKGHGVKSKASTNSSTSTAVLSSSTTLKSPSSMKYELQRQLYQQQQQINKELQIPTATIHRSSNLPTPVSHRRKGNDTSATSTSRVPSQPVSKSIRTGKQLSAVPADDVLPMSPLMDLPSSALNKELDYKGKNTSFVTTRRNSRGKTNKFTRGTSSRSDSISTDDNGSLQQNRYQRSMSLDSVDILLATDSEDDIDNKILDESTITSSKKFGSDVSFLSNDNDFDTDNPNLSYENTKVRSVNHSYTSTSTSRRSSLERPKVSSNNLQDGKSHNEKQSRQNHFDDDQSIANSSHNADNIPDANRRRQSFKESRSNASRRSRSLSRPGRNSLLVREDSNKDLNHSMSMNISNAHTTVSYQGQREDDSFKAQILALREENNADYELFGGTNREHLDDKEELNDADAMRIRVVIRKRPMSKNEIAAAGDVDVIHPFDNGTYGRILAYQPKTRVDLTKEIETIPFAYDNVFDEFSSNVDIYQKSVRNIIPSFFCGQWASVFAYGQTGSGKTYTMMGCNMTGIKDGSCTHDDPSNLGLYYMAALDIFHALKSPEWKDYMIGTSMFEIYGGKLFDLLNQRENVKCLEDAKGKVCFPGLSEHSVSCPQDLIDLIDRGACNRSTGTTSRNADSSRSHAVLQLHLRKRRPVGNSKMKNSSNASVEFSRLTFIDLAGSERGADTQNSSRATRLEGAEINTSLLALKEVIRALAQSNDANNSAMQHVPFRGSKLTQVLKESFIGKHSRCVMIACISPNISNCEQTLNTLRYADRVKERNSEDGSIPNSLIHTKASTLNSPMRRTGPATTKQIQTKKINLPTTFSLHHFNNDNSETLVTEDDSEQLGNNDDDGDDDSLFQSVPSPARNNVSSRKPVVAQSLGKPKNHDEVVTRRRLGTDEDYDSFFDDDDEVEMTSASLRQEVMNAKAKVATPRRDEIVKPTQKTSRGHPRGNGITSSNHSYTSNTSDVLDALLASPDSTSEANDESQGDSTDFTTKKKNAMQMYETRNAKPTTTTPVRIKAGSAAMSIEQTPQSKNNDQIEHEQRSIAKELISVHRDAMSYMLSMIKDEMTLVSEADNDREIFLTSYIQEVQSLQDKNLEWIALLREHLLKYRIMSSAATTASAAANNSQMKTYDERKRYSLLNEQQQQHEDHDHHERQRRRNRTVVLHNRNNNSNDDDDSFIDLRDE